MIAKSLYITSSLNAVWFQTMALFDRFLHLMSLFLVFTFIVSLFMAISFQPPFKNLSQRDISTKASFGTDFLGGYKNLMYFLLT